MVFVDRTQDWQDSNQREYQLNIQYSQWRSLDHVLVHPFSTTGVAGSLCAFCFCGDSSWGCVFLAVLASSWLLKTCGALLGRFSLVIPWLVHRATLPGPWIQTVSWARFPPARCYDRFSGSVTVFTERIPHCYLRSRPPPWKHHNSSLSMLCPNSPTWFHLHRPTLMMFWIRPSSTRRCVALGTETTWETHEGSPGSRLLSKKTEVGPHHAVTWRQESESESYQGSYLQTPAAKILWNFDGFFGRWIEKPPFSSSDEILQDIGSINLWARFF